MDFDVRNSMTDIVRCSSSTSTFPSEIAPLMVRYPEPTDGEFTLNSNIP